MSLRELPSATHLCLSATSPHSATPAVPHSHLHCTPNSQLPSAIQQTPDAPHSHLHCTPGATLTAPGLSNPVRILCKSSFFVTIQSAASQLLDRRPQLRHTAPNDTPGALQPPSDLHLSTSNPRSASFQPPPSQPTPVLPPNQHSKAVKASSTA